MLNKIKEDEVDYDKRKKDRNSGEGS